VLKLIGLLLIIWLAIGAIAAGQRYYSGSATNCAKDSTTAVTIVAGVLNYVGANPRVHCKLPQPSK
jgi:hypothetical protein